LLDCFSHQTLRQDQGHDVKRGFLFGLGSFFIAGAIAGAVGGLIGTSRIAGFIMALVFMPLSVVVIRKAKSAPPHRSLQHAFMGWLLGFFAVDIAIFAVIFMAIGAAKLATMH
jgi:hypothetical protein